MSLWIRTPEIIRRKAERIEGPRHNLLKLSALRPVDFSQTFALPPHQFAGLVIPGQQYSAQTIKTCSISSQATINSTWSRFRHSTCIRSASRFPQNYPIYLASAAAVLHRNTWTKYWPRQRYLGARSTPPPTNALRCGSSRTCFLRISSSSGLFRQSPANRHWDWNMFERKQDE